MVYFIIGSLYYTIHTLHFTVAVVPKIVEWSLWKEKYFAKLNFLKCDELNAINISINLKAFMFWQIINNERMNEWNYPKFCWACADTTRSSSSIAKHQTSFCLHKKIIFVFVHFLFLASSLFFSGWLLTGQKTGHDRLLLFHFYIERIRLICSTKRIFAAFSHAHKMLTLIFESEQIMDRNWKGEIQH